MSAKYRPATAVLLVIVVILSCSIVGVRVVHANASWTFMVYIQNDLSPAHGGLGSAAATNLNQMESVGSSTNVKIVALDAEYGANTVYYQVNSGSLQTRNDFTMSGRLDLTNPSVLSTFVTWTAQQYSANNYALILWDHASGAPRGLLPGEASGSVRVMTLQTLLQGLRATNLHLNIIGFDACLMGMIETAYQLYRVPSNGLELGDPSLIPDFMVASEEEIPGDGWPYNTILSGLAANPTWTPAQLAESIVSNYKNAYQGGSVSTSTTMSALDLRSTAFTNVMYDVYQLGGGPHGLESVMGTYKSALTQAISDSMSERFPHRFPYDSWGYVDLYYLATNIKARVSDSNVQTYCTNLQSDMGALFPSARYWADPNTHPNAHGLSIYMPTSYESSVLNTEDSLRFSLGTWWNGMIRSYLGLFDFWISLNPGWCLNVSPGSSCQIGVTLTLESGTSQLVDISANMIPSNIGTPSTSSITPTQSSTLTINIASGAPSGYLYAWAYAQQHGSNLLRISVFWVQVSTSNSVTTAQTIRTFSEARNYVPLVAGWSMLDGLTPDATSLTVASGVTLFLAARSMDNSIWYRGMGSSGVWSSWGQVPGLTDVRPAVAVFNGRLYFVCKEAGTSRIWFGYYPLSGGVVSGSFSGWTLLPGPTPAALSVATDGSYLYVAAEGMDGSLWHQRMSSSGSWSGWVQIPGLTDVSPAITVFNNRLYFACKEKSTNRIWYGYVDLTSYPNGWSGWTLIPGPTPDALALATSSDHMFLAARGTDNGIWYRGMDSTGAWSDWSSNVYGPTPSPVGLAVYSNALYFSAQGSYNSMWMNSWSFAKGGQFSITDYTSELSSATSLSPNFLLIITLLAVGYATARLALTRRHPRTVQRSHSR